MLLLIASASIGAATPLPTIASGEPFQRQRFEANPHCPAIIGYEAGKSRGKSRGRAEFRRLDELPAADAFRAVYRTINGCMAPVVVRYGLGR